MKYISTTGKGVEYSFRQAVLGNLPKDGGLFFPTKIPQLNPGFLEDIRTMELPDIASYVLNHFCYKDISKTALEAITKRVYDFSIPVQRVEEGIFCLELFHGPTYAFKDIGARFLAECLAFFGADHSKPTTVLVATSGDTGGAVANGFLGVEGVEVIILYPKGKVSELQEKQLTTLGQNIKALEVSGTFDDCQNMVKKAFADEEVAAKRRLSSANSINIARWLPQSIYFYLPFQQRQEEMTIAVPSGNYGNLTSGVLAKKMGVPISGFVAASNANDVVPRYLRSGHYDPEETIPTIANAMDVSDPSNFKRLLSLYDGEYESIRKDLTPFTLHDQQILQTIKSCKKENDYLLDPHSAIGYQAIKEQGEGVFLGTAHYCKFLPTLESALGDTVPLPEFAKELMVKSKHSTQMSANYEEFKEYLLD